MLNLSERFRKSGFLFMYYGPASVKRLEGRSVTNHKHNHLKCLTILHGFMYYGLLQMVKIKAETITPTSRLVRFVTLCRPQFL